jgi:hypothetical protein
MKRFSPLKILFSIMIALSILTGLFPVSSVDAAPPTPTSALIDRFVSEVDNTYGYQIFRPASWTSVDLGDRREFVSPDSIDQSNRIMLIVTNLQVVSDKIVGKNGLIANYGLFKQEPSITAWMQKTEALWQMDGTQYVKVGELPNAMIFAVRPNPDQLHLIAYVVSQDQPLAMALIGYGSFNDLDALKKTGLLIDFETMVSSASAYPSSVYSSPEPNAPILTFLMESGPWHSDSGNRTEGVFTYRLQTDYYQSPSRIYWLYEYMYYGGDPTHDTWLYSTSVTDYPSTTCTYNNSYLLWHSIAKMASRTSHSVSDSYTPNQVVAHLNSTTAHMMIFGDPMMKICEWYFPFTHQ